MTTKRNKYDMHGILSNVYTVSSIVAGVASVALVALTSAREQQQVGRRRYAQK